MVKVKIKRGDTVTIIAGDDKGKSGKVLMINNEQSRILVEGINFVKKQLFPKVNLFEEEEKLSDNESSDG